MADQYQYWRDALKGQFNAVHDGDPQPGFYRRRMVKNGPFVPVAIWFARDKMVAVVDGNEVDANDVWTWVCQNPITEAAYNYAVAGKGWDDEPEPAKAPTGGNMPSDPHDALEAEWQGEKEIGQEILASPIKTQQKADQAAVFTKRLSVISKKATDLHKVEKQPALDEGRRVDDHWRDLKTDPATMSKNVKRHMDAYLQEQQRLERERQRKAQEEADRRQRIADEAAAKAAKTENDSEAAANAERLAEDAANAENEAKARNPQAGRTGSKVSLRKFVTGEITDFDKLLDALKDRPEIQDCVQNLANRAAKSGIELPGMKIKTEQRAA